MSHPAVTVSPSATVTEIAHKLLDHNVRAVAVVDASDRLVGIISESDLVVRNSRLHFPAFLGILDNLLPVGGDRNLDEELRKVLAVTAAEVMEKDVFCVPPDMDLADAVHEMLQKRVHAVPVVKDGRVLGVLYPSDVVKLIALDAIIG